MKLPKTKTGLFVVVRKELDTEVIVPIGIFVTLEAAEDYSGACLQDFTDSGITQFDFFVSYVTFYNE